MYKRTFKRNEMIRNYGDQQVTTALESRLTRFRYFLRIYIQMKSAEYFRTYVLAREFRKLLKNHRN